MSTYLRPGAFVEETFPRLTSALPTDGGVSVGALIGANPRGPIKPTLITSWSDARKQFGPVVADSPLSLALSQFFSNGGSAVWATRVVGAGAVAASRTLKDQAAVSPVDTLQVTALNPGAWGNDIYLDVLAGSAADRFTLIVKYGGTTSASIVERYIDLSMSSSSERYVLAAVNGLSKYIVVANLNSGTAAPLNTPALQTGTALASGANGAAPLSDDFDDALPLYDTVQGPLVLNLVDVTTPSVVNTALTYASERGDIFVVVDPNGTKDVAGVLADATSLTSTSYGAVYFPQIVIPDPLSVVPGATRTIPPGSSVVAAILATDTSRGVFKAPAGLATTLANVIAPAHLLTASELDSLNSGNPPVNAIRAVPGAGTVVMGARTLKTGAADKYVPVRRSLIYVRKNLLDITEFAVFEPNDEVLWEDVRTRVESFLTEFWQDGGLRGNTPQQAFFVKCDAENNSAADIENGTVNVEVGVAMQYPAEFIVIRLGQYEGGSTATESEE